MAKRYDPIMCMMVDEPAKAQDANTLYETFAHGNSKHAGVLEMNGKVKVVVWNEGDNPRTGKVTVIGEDTPANRSKAKSMLDSAKAKDKLVKVPDSKLKDFEANLRSAGFKVVSKSDRGKSTHYQVEVSSSKKFTEADLKEWANKIDAVCDKMDSVAPTTWNIGLTADGKITAGLDVREMYVKDSASVLDKAITTADGMLAVEKQLACTEN